MIAAASNTANESTLSWLDGVLEHARDHAQVKLEELLRTVRTEIVFEMELDGVSLGRFAARERTPRR